MIVNHQTMTATCLDKLSLFKQSCLCKILLQTFKYAAFSMARKSMFKPSLSIHCTNSLFILTLYLLFKLIGNSSVSWKHPMSTMYACFFRYCWCKFCVLSNTVYARFFVQTFPLWLFLLFIFLVQTHWLLKCIIKTPIWYAGF